MKRHPSILIVGNFLSQNTGLRTVCEDFARLLVKSSWSVITTSNKICRVSRLLDMVITVWRHRTEYELACVDTYSGSAFVWAECVCFLLQWLGKPYILILHGGDLPKFAGRWPGRVTRLLKHAAEVISPSQYLQEKMRFYRTDIKVIPNPLELSDYHYRLRYTAVPKLIWLRAFHRIYNPSLAPRVLAELNKHGIKSTLNMVGPDKRDGSLEEMLRVADELQVRSQISIVGGIPKDQVPLKLLQCDIFINTTNVDNTPVSIIEAMACGLCIVTTNVGGISSLLEDGVDALLVPPDNPEAMAEAIQRVLIEPGLAKRLSANAGEKAARFDWSGVLSKWEEIFEGIIQVA
jgi:glycosyltransferase involved in cell wall biosynthesis